jgi:hypothetical protein
MWGVTSLKMKLRPDRLTTVHLELRTDHSGTDPQMADAMPDVVRRANRCATSSHLAQEILEVSN